MTALRFLKSSLTGLAATITVAGGLTLAPASSQAGCFGCGFDVGVGLGGLALGALAAGSRANERQYGYPDEPQGQRQPGQRPRGQRPPVVTYDPSDPEAPQAAPQQRPAKPRKAVAQKPSETAKKVAAAPEGDTKKSTRSVALANTGALEP
jgi:hypothetical protein